MAEAQVKGKHQDTTTRCVPFLPSPCIPHGEYWRYRSCSLKWCLILICIAKHSCLAQLWLDLRTVQSGQCQNRQLAQKGGVELWLSAMRARHVRTSCWRNGSSAGQGGRWQRDGWCQKEEEQEEAWRISRYATWRGGVEGGKYAFTGAVSPGPITDKVYATCHTGLPSSPFRLQSHHPAIPRHHPVHRRPQCPRADRASSHPVTVHQSSEQMYGAPHFARSRDG